MTPKQLCGRLNDMLVNGLAKGVFKDVKPQVLRGAGANEVLAPASPPGMLSADGIGISDYVKILDSGGYTALFADDALAIVECRFEDGMLVKHRYHYIPCPIVSSARKECPPEIPLADWIGEMSHYMNVECFRSVGTYRFDYSSSPIKSAEPHPLSHWTFGSSGCRVPVKAPLGLDGFFHFLFDNYYREHRPFWQSYAPYLSCQLASATISEDELLVHHLSWMEAER